MITRILPADALARSVADARAVAGGRAALAARDELIDTLTGAMLGPVALTEYLAAVGTDVPTARLAAGDGLPPGRVAADGLGWASDGQLARLALDPDGVTALNAAVESALLDGTAGPGWWAAVDLPDDALPPDYLPPDCVPRLVAAAEAAATDRMPSPAAPLPATTPAVSRGGRAPAAWASLAALAAGVLGFGVFLGTRFSEEPREVASLSPEELSRDLSPETREALLRAWGGESKSKVLAGDARTRPDATKGPDGYKLEVQNSDDRRAYVTIVGLSAGKRPTFQTKAPVGDRDQWIALDPGETRALIPSAVVDNAETFLIVLTPTPAGEVVREIVLRPPPAASAEAARDAVTAELKALGYTRLNVFLVRPPAGNP
jgi:hypothetical protein